MTRVEKRKGVNRRSSTIEARNESSSESQRRIRMRFFQDVSSTFHRPQSRLGYEERPQSRVGYASDSRCASGLGYDDTGGGYLDQSDPRMYCTGGYCMGDTMMATSRGVCGEEVELDMRRHIQACACTCNHMGYGNYMDYQVSRDDVVSSDKFSSRGRAKRDDEILGLADCTNPLCAITTEIRERIISS